MLFWVKNSGEWKTSELTFLDFSDISLMQSEHQNDDLLIFSDISLRESDHQTDLFDITFDAI